MARRYIQLYVWDPKDQVLRYDGTEDPDPDWKWNPEKNGYEPVDSMNKVWDRRFGGWVFVQLAD